MCLASPRPLRALSCRWTPLNDDIINKNTATATLSWIGNKIKCGQTHSTSLYNQLCLKTTFTITLTPPRVFQSEAARDAWTMSECCLCGAALWSTTLTWYATHKYKFWTLLELITDYVTDSECCLCVEQNCDQPQHDTYARTNSLAFSNQLKSNTSLIALIFCVCYIFIL